MEKINECCSFIFVFTIYCKIKAEASCLLGFRLIALRLECFNFNKAVAKVYDLNDIAK